MARDSFPEGVPEKLKWYVYRLIDPRNGETFYVGKGRGNRVFAHASGQTPSEEIKDGELGPKLERIRAIKASGLEVGHIIHRHGLSTADRAFEVEAALIDAYPGLSNQVIGVGSRVRGSRYVEEIIIEYAAEEFQVKEPLMMISIGVSYYERDDPYDAVRYAWQVNVQKANQYNLVLARLRGLIVGAYRPDKWLPTRRIVVVADRNYAALELLNFCQSLTQPVTFITRLRLDAALYEPPPTRLPGQIGRPRIKGQRLPSLIDLLVDDDVSWDRVSVVWHDGNTRTLQLCSQTAHWYSWGRPPVPIRWVLIQDPLGQLQTQALLCTEASVDPIQVVQWFVLRWRVEFTFQEVREHLGVETQRQWSDRAIARTTPLLLGLFSWVTLATKLLHQEHPSVPRTASWYPKTEPTFIDAIALVRRHLWLGSETLSTSGSATDAAEVPLPLFNRLVESLTYAA